MTLYTTPFIYFPVERLVWPTFSPATTNKTILFSLLHQITTNVSQNRQCKYNETDRRPLKESERDTRERERERERERDRERL